MLTDFQSSDFQIAKALFANGLANGFRLKKGVGWLTWDFNLQSWLPNRANHTLGEWGLKFRQVGANAIANKLENYSSAQSILKQLLDYPEFTETNWNPVPELVGVGNGAFDIKTLEFRKQKPKDFISINIPVMYNPNAKCPGFDKFLEEVQPNEDRRKYLQKLLGTGMLPRTADQTFHFWHGGGSNGKGILGNVIGSVLGPMCGTISSDVFMKRGDESATRFALSRLQECRLLFASEVDKGSSLGENRVKQLSGEEPVVVEEKGKTQESVTFNATLIMRVNDIPKISDSSYAMMRRIRVVPFDQQFDPHQNQYLQSELEREKEGILLWLIEGAHLYLKEGLGYPETISISTKAAIRDSFEYADFFQDCLLIDPDCQETLKDIKIAYVDWAKELGQPSFITSQKLAEAMRNYIVDSKTPVKLIKPQNITTYKGVRLRTSKRPENYGL